MKIKLEEKKEYEKDLLRIKNSISSIKLAENIVLSDATINLKMADFTGVNDLKKVTKAIYNVFPDAFDFIVIFTDGTDQAARFTEQEALTAVNNADENISFFTIGLGDEIDEIERIEIETGKRIESLENSAIFPANLYIAPRDRLNEIIVEIQDELFQQEKYFEREKTQILTFIDGTYYNLNKTVVKNRYRLLAL